MAAMKKKISTGVTQDDLNKSLTNSSKSGDLDGVKKALKDGAEINANGGQPLLVAVWNGKFKTTEFLLKSGANCSAPIIETMTTKSLLCIGVFSGELKVVELLVEYGADLTKDGAEALDTSIRNAENKISLYLIREMAENGIQSDENLELAAKKGYTTIVKSFLDTGLYSPQTIVNAIKPTVKPEHLDIIQHISENGTDISEIVQDTLALAARYDRNNFAKYLISECHGNPDTASANTIDSSLIQWCKKYKTAMLTSRRLEKDLNPNTKTKKVRRHKV